LIVFPKSVISIAFANEDYDTGHFELSSLSNDDKIFRVGNIFGNGSRI